MRSLYLACVLALAAVAMLGPAPARADVTIYDVRTGVYPEGTVVEIDNVVVTAVGMFVYFVQEPDPGPFGQYQYGAIQIYTAANHTVHKGDVVNVKGTYMEFRGMSEIDVTIAGSFQTTIGTGAIPAPVPCLMSEINDTGALGEAYEGVLVRVDRNDNSLYAYPPDNFDTWALKSDPGLPPGQGDSLLVCHWSAKPGDDFLYTTPQAGSLLTYAQGILIMRTDWTPAVRKLAPRDCENDLGTGCPPMLLGTYATSGTTMNVQFSVNMDAGTAGIASNYTLVSGNSVLTAQRDPVLKKVIHLTTGQQVNVEPETIIISGINSEVGVPMTPNQTFDFRAGITPIDSTQYVTNPAVSGDSPLNLSVVTTTGRVTAVEGNYYYLQTGSGGPWQGLYCRVAGTGTLVVGDSVQVSGEVYEYNSETELRYHTGVDNYRNYGRAPHAVVVSTVNTPDIPFRGLAHTAERWEGCLVKLPNATFKDSIVGVPGPYFGEWIMKQQTNPVYQDTASCALNAIFPIGGFQVDACVGDRVDITGILRYTYGWYRIAPRSGRGGDVVFLFDNPNCAPVTVEDPRLNISVSLDQNQPNPFGRSTSIRFTLPYSLPVTLEVLDVGGRLVKRLASEPLTAGDHAFRWDGTNSVGREVGAGTYFYRLQGGGMELSRKMIFLP